jgi:hypothetical protein
LALPEKQKEPIGGKRRIATPGPEKGRTCYLKTWKHEVDVVSVCADRETRRADLHLGVGTQQGIGKARSSRGEAWKGSGLIRAPDMSSFPGSSVENLARETSYDLPGRR